MAVSKYGGLKSLVNQYLLEETTLTYDEIEEKIYEAYQNNELTGHQYDNLMALLSDI